MKFQHRFSACGAIMFALLMLPAATAVDLTGKVTNAAGELVEGVTVFVFTAAPKVGTSPYCPSCYPDCGKTAKSDAAGNFTVAGMSSELTFKLLVVGKAYAPQFVPNVAPGEKHVEVTLQPRTLENSPAAQTVRGRIVDPSGGPIFGAVVEVNGADFGQTRQHGGLRDTDPLAVTDETGNFAVTTKLSPVALFVRVTARLYSSQALHLATGEPHVITMTEGATLAGRIMKDGQPLPYVGVGLSAQDRSAGSFAGHFEVGTDAEGRFAFLNLPPNIDYYVYGLMETVGPHGTIPLRPVHVSRNRERTELGDVALRPAHRLAGRVVLEDGEKLPPKTRLLITRDRAWDSLSIELGPNGEFEAKGIPTETISLSIRVPDYIISPKNGSYEPANRRLVGQIASDVPGFEMLLEKGTLPKGPYSVASLPRFKPGEHPRDQPLRGVESRSK